MRQKFASKCLVLLLAMVIPNLVFAQAGHREAEDTLDKMMEEGWKPVAPGVLQRGRSENKVETFAIGPEGLKWALQEIESRLAFLQKQYRVHRKGDLQRAINDLRASIARLREDLRRAEAEPVEVVVEKNDCGASYDATGDAYHLTNVAGTAATASASFNNACGYYAETFAYGYASATRGSLTETLTHSDPMSGYNISSSANVSVQGTAPCYSEAYAYSRYTGGNIFLSSFDTNSLCPPPSTPPTVTISGTEGEYFSTAGCRTSTWTTAVSNGVPPYTYQWYLYGNPVGTGSSYSGCVCSLHKPGFDLSVTVTDSVGQAGSDTHYVSVVYNNQPRENCYYLPSGERECFSFGG